MEKYKKILKEEVEEFRIAGHQFLDGALTKNEFKGKSGGMGVYAQQDQKSFMIRLRTPSGVASREHLKLILHYTKKYQLEKVHLTTRQAVQLHNLKIDEVCDIMADAIDHDLFTRGGGGNFPRNVSLSPMAGVDKQEAFDVTAFARLTGTYFLKRATTYHLPRKLKVAFSSSCKDTACATMNDVGFMAVLQDGKPMFRMWLAGGLGGGPAVAVEYPDLVKPEEVLYYVEAMVQLFMAEGDYENKAKARTRFIPRRMGVEAFLKCYNEHLGQVKESNMFTEISVDKDAVNPKYDIAVCDSKDTPTCIAQKQDGLYTVILHPVCGQLAAVDLEKLIRFIEEIEKAEVRVSMTEDLYVRNLTKEQAEQLQAVMGDAFMRTPVQMTVSCIGVPSCQMGILQSQELCRAILKAVEEAGLTTGRLPMIQISGCPNSCARHQIAEIGFAGRKIKVDGSMEDAFSLFVGGKVGETDTHMGELRGVLTAREIPAFIVELGRLLEQEQKTVAELAGQEVFEKLVAKYKQ